MTKQMTSPSNNRRPILLALAASFLLTVLIVVGSRNLEHYDSALFGYTVASVVAFGAIVFRYAIWLQRPATRVYWRRGWKLYLQREKFVQNTTNAAKTLATNLVGQRFIFKRGFSRWAMHFLIMWGCVLSALITFPLVFGWVHFKLEGELGYRAYVFGFPLNVMQGRSLIAWVTFHALDFTALMVIAGCAIAIHRRLRDRGAIALQQFTLDFVPHMLLIAISVTGLMLTASSLWLNGYMYHFIALTHDGDHDALLSTIRQAVSRGAAPSVDWCRALSGTRPRNAASQVRALRSGVRGATLARRFENCGGQTRV